MISSGWTFQNDSELGSKGRSARLRGAAALPLRALHTRAAAARAASPRAPGAPAAVDGLGTVPHGHALTVEAPLQRDRTKEQTWFTDAVSDDESESPAAGSTEAQHVLSHGSPCAACMELPGGQLGSARAWGTSKQRGTPRCWVFEATHSIGDPSARGFVAWSQPKGKRQPRTKARREVLQGAVAKPRVIPDALGPRLWERTPRRVLED